MEPASTSIWTAPVLGSNEVFCNLKLFGPGLIVPFSVLPSHFNSRVTACRCDGVGPQFPVHLPLRGSVALCASREDDATQRAINRKQKAFNCIVPTQSNVWHKLTTTTDTFFLLLSRIRRKVRFLSRGG